MARSIPDRWWGPAFRLHLPDPPAPCAEEPLDVAGAAWRVGGVPHLVADNPAPALQLSRVVELEIIPRLMLLHSSQAPAIPPAPSPAFAITAAHVETLTHLAVDPDPARALDFVAAVSSAGAPRQDVLLKLLVPAARLMGQLWIDDVYDFSQVTIGLWRLQQVLHDEALRLRAPGMPRGGRALFAVVPGSQHSFGVSIVAEFFARDGWTVDFDPCADWPDVRRAVENETYDVLGVSISMDEQIPSVASAILDLRRASCARDLYVMVGGPVASRLPDLARRCAADAMATEAPEALAMANRRLAAVLRAESP